MTNPVAAPPEADALRAELLRAGILPPDGVVELRILDAETRRDWQETCSGYFDPAHFDDFCRAALKDWGQSAKVFLTLQRVKPACLNRRVNHVAAVRKGKTTGNTDIERLIKFVVDVDAIRPISDVPATDGEKAEAKAVLKAVLADLTARGWPSPVIIDTGNGHMAEYPIDEPVDAAEVVTKALKALAAKHSTTGAKVDVTMGDPAQIRRVPGTINRKVEPTADRPHRPCRILRVPDAKGLVTREQLEALAAEAPPNEKKRAAATGTGTNGHYDSRLKVADWLRDRGVAFTIKGKTTDDGRTVHLLAECPFDSSHGRTNEVCIMQAADGALSAKCMHNSCAGRRWQDFKQAIGAPDAHHYDPPLSGAASTRRASRPTPNATVSRPPTPGDVKGDAREADDATAETLTGCQIILTYFHERYRPQFRIGTTIRAGDGSDVPMGVACALPDSNIIDRLVTASDAPTYAGGGVKRSSLPYFFKNWAKVAWGDMLAQLPEEDTAELEAVGTSREQFRQLMRDALFTGVTLAQVHRSGPATTESRTEHRSLIGWCSVFAKVGPWRSIRDYQCWCRLDTRDDGELVLRVALRHGLFAQLKTDRRLVTMTENTFTRRAKRYDIGTSSRSERPHGRSAVVLDNNFVAGLTAGLPAEEPAERREEQES